MAYVIGIDIGTSGCKTVAVDRSGAILATGFSAYPLLSPQPGWYEQNAEDWRNGLLNSVKELTGKLGGAKADAVCVTGQMHGLVALDSEVKVLRNPILWNDQRTQAQCDAITETAGGLNSLLMYTNNMMLTGYTGSKLLWMKENEPQIFEKIHVLLCPKDYIRYLLCGNVCTDVSDASGTGLFSVKDRVWAYELIGKAGLPDYIFPPCVESTERVGYITRPAADETGLPDGIPVFAGGGDAVISAMGMGLAPGCVGVTLGTSGVVAMNLPGYGDNKGGLLQFFCGNIPDSYTAFGCTLFAAGAYGWYRDTFYPGLSFRELDDEAALISPGSGGLIFKPYLNGERCPHFNSSLTGSFSGITAQMNRRYFSRAVLEGVAYSQKQVFELIKKTSPDLDIASITVAGGGAKSPLWKQILADVFSLPVRTVRGSGEGASYGAALIALAGMGYSDNPYDTMSCVAAETETVPLKQNSEIYMNSYEKYINNNM